MICAKLGGDNRRHLVQRGTVFTRAYGHGVWTLGLSLQARRSTWLAVAALGAYFGSSMARDLSLYDSGELALAAVQLGLAHPPGQPLHTLLGFLLSHVPFLPALVGVNLLSALPAALTLIPATSVAQRMLGPSAAPAAVSSAPWLLALCALHVCVWEPATRVEVYALASFGAVWTLAAAMGLDDVPRMQGVRWRLFRLGVALGLTASVNPVIAIIAALAVAPVVAQRLLSLDGVANSTRALRSAFAGACAAIAGGLIGCFPYAYLPIVAARTDVMVWGAPRDLGGYLRYLTLRDYAHNQGIAFELWIEHCSQWLRWASETGLAPVIALGMIAHLALGATASRRIMVPLIASLSLGAIALNAVWHVDVPDYNGYMAPAFWMLAAGAIALGLRRHSNLGRQLVMLALASTCVVSALFASPSVFARTRSSDRLARELAQRVLAQAPQAAIVISETDAVTGALFYLQGAERARPDVAVLAYGLASSSWHWEQLFRAHAALKPIALQSGARNERVMRWLAANSQRPVLVERLSTARQLGLAACPGDLFLQAGALCRGAPRQSPAVARFIADRLAKLGHGSPSVEGLLAQTSYELGEALWRLGDAQAAHDMLLAGVPRAAWPASVLAKNFDRAPVLPPSAASISFSRPAALGDPGRNLFLAGAIAGSTGEREVAAQYLEAAAATGLPEALRAREGGRPR